MLKLKSLMGAALLAATAATAQAASYPDRAVTIVVPFPAGGSTDYCGRLAADILSKQLKGNFIVQNKPGATGSIGAAEVKRAAPDGYTLLVSSPAVFAVNEYLFKSLQYDPVKDFDPITILVRAPNVLVANPKSPAQDVPSLIRLLKEHPGTVTFASSGNGATDHLTAELFWQKTGTKGLHIPYKGGAPAIADLMGGQVQYSFQNVNAVIGQIRSGKLKALAVTADQRSPVLPNVPTMAEAGVAGLAVYSWQAAVAPHGIPADIQAKLNQALVKGLHQPEVKAKLEHLGFEVVGDTPEEFRKFQLAEMARWKNVIETAHISIN